MEQSPLAVHHVGIAVPSIDDAMHFYGDKLGLDLVDSVELPDRQLKVAFVRTSNMLLELLEPTDPGSTISRFLERRGPGLHHLCFGTPDIREHLRDLRDKGVELIDAAPRPGAHGEVAFLQPSAALGVLVELLQPPPDKSTPVAATETSTETTTAAVVTETSPQTTTAAAVTETSPETATLASDTVVAKDAASEPHAAEPGGSV